MSAPPKLPTDPDRRAVALNLLRSHRVARLVRGREPVRVTDVVGMLMSQFSLTEGAAQSAVDRAVDAGEVETWLTLPSPGEPEEPDAERVLAAVEDEAETVAGALREARAGDGGC